LDSEKLFCTIVDDKDTIFLHFKHYFARGGRCAKTFKNLYFMTKFALLFFVVVLLFVFVFSVCSNCSASVGIVFDRFFS